MCDFVDTHVHLWSADSLPPWLSDPALASIAKTQSVADYRLACGSGHSRLRHAVYMEVDVAPEKREAEAKFAVDLCRDPRNHIAGAVWCADCRWHLRGV